MDDDDDDDGLSDVLVSYWYVGMYIFSCRSPLRLPRFNFLKLFEYVHTCCKVYE